MRSIISRRVNRPVNYNCPECMKTKQLPNIAGRFHIINATQCQCNGCDTVYSKETYYTDMSPLNRS